MRKILLIPALLFVIGCGSDEPEIKKKFFYVCDCNQMQQVRNDIKQSIAPANNRSDEEMEDVIEQLQWTFIHTSCPKVFLEYVDYDIPIKTDSCKFYFPK